MKILFRVCAVVFLFLLAAPMLQSAFKLFPKVPLGGVEEEIEKPVLTVNSWFSGEFQQKYEKMLNKRIGLRSYFVRTYNQVYFILFGRLPPSSGTQVVIGKDFWLYESSYIKAYNKNGDALEDTLRKKVSGLKELQEKMKDRGKIVLLVIAPSKVEIYPEYLPDGMITTDRQKLRTEYDRILPLLDEFGINYVDAHRVFVSKKKGLPYPLFATGGTHWNYYGAGIIAEQIMEGIGIGLGRKVPNISCKSLKIDRKPFGTDDDLGALLNIWFSTKLAGVQIHPVFERRDGEYSPNILLVGDSFVFTLSYIIGTENLSSQCDVFYYFNKHFVSMDTAKSESIDRDAVDWNKELLSRDAIIIEINEYWLPDIGFGFVKAALAGLAKIEDRDSKK